LATNPVASLALIQAANRFDVNAVVIPSLSALGRHALVQAQLAK
jgi:hypothetical protein